MFRKYYYAVGKNNDLGWDCSIKFLKPVFFMNQWALGPKVSFPKFFEFGRVIVAVFTKTDSISVIIMMLSDHVA